MHRAFRWLESHGLTVAAFATLVGSLATAGLVWYLWVQFDAKSQGLARRGSESAEYMAIATMVLGRWILPALVGVSVLALATFAIALGRRRSGECPAQTI